jgi:hypothetical protein
MTESTRHFFIAVVSWSPGVDDPLDDLRLRESFREETLCLSFLENVLESKFCSDVRVERWMKEEREQLQL